MVEESIPLQEGFKELSMLSKKLIEQHKQKYKYLHLGMIQIGLKPLTRLGLNTSALILVRDKRHNQFEDSLLGIVESTLCDGPVYFKCFPNFTVSLTDANIMQSLILNIKTEGFDMLKGTPNVALVHRLCYKVMNTVVPKTRVSSTDIYDKKGETTLFITDLEKNNILVPKTTLEQAVPPVKEPPRQVESILQYLDGDVEIKFSQNRKVRLNIGDIQRPNTARSSTSEVLISELEKERQRIEILRVNKIPEQVSQPEYKKIQKMFNKPQNIYKKQWFLSYHTLKKQKWYLKNYMFYCEKIGEIVDFFQWIEEAYYELQKDFPNFNNSSQIAVIESTYQTYITAKGKSIQALHLPYAIPFKHGVANDGITHVLQQNNYTNMCMQSISKQTSRIEEIVSKIETIEKGESSKAKEDSVPFKPPPSFENEKFHLNSKKDSEFVEELIVRLQKIKVEEQKTQVAITTLKEENSSDETPNEDVQPYFPRPSPVDIQFEENADFAQFNGESIVEWNIDGMSEYQIRTIVKYMLMYASAAKLKGNKDEAIAKAIITGFTGQLQGWWNFYLKDIAKDKILKAIRNDPTTNEQKSNAVNTLIYTIMAHFVGANELLSNRTTEQLINLQCPTLSYFYWYKSTFMAIVMTRKDCNENFWKEKFLSGLPKSFAERMRNKLKAKYNNNIPYSQLEYGDLAAEVIAEGINFCNDIKLEKQENREILENFCEQIGYQPIEYPKKETNKK
ncbi:hypothetical protein CDL12_28556 [Handroanthus impetiginosus]|uniref:Uncharacterized protein n=1 Tax=Handroanthus impetiginosus TaxID=429701 RepID=A0A2G9G0X3_9LAMI|nr:hypothetical protein CDL12_28556 [Handroanthus impetiginosus]